MPGDTSESDSTTVINPDHRTVEGEPCMTDQDPSVLQGALARELQELRKEMSEFRIAFVRLATEFTIVKRSWFAFLALALILVFTAVVSGVLTTSGG